MSYLFVTGVTGLLGEYLLRDLTLAHKPIAVLARKSRDASACNRIEHIFANWERQLGYGLPRPVVLEGDITKPMFGLSSADIEWLSVNCTSFLNNAASLTFEGNRSDGEPWVSNLQGTLFAIELCRVLGISNFHHVSTSYVCGLRQGVILETEVDEGQAFANEYEASKCAAETSIRNAGFSSLTIYRPAIIVGDSVTGYTSTYHGFYAPLKAMHALLSMRQNLGGINADKVDSAPTKVPLEPMLKALGLTGNENKNFVPVEWVSQVIASAVVDPNFHGNTYHLTPSKRVSAIVAAKAIQASLEEHLGAKKPVAQANEQRDSETTSSTPQQSSDESTWDSLGESFAGQVSVYQEYWREDPIFDATNRERAFPDLECPELTFEVLKRLCDFSLKSGFGWPKQRIPNVDKTLPRWLNDHGIIRGKVASPVVRLIALGSGGGEVVIGESGTGFEFDFRHSPNVPGWKFRADTLAESTSFVQMVQSGLAIFVSSDAMCETSCFENALRESIAILEKIDRAIGSQFNLPSKSHSDTPADAPPNPPSLLNRPFVRLA